MKSKVADQVRRARIEEELRLTPAERVARALELGEEQLRILMAARGIDRDEALRISRENKARGRR